MGSDAAFSRASTGSGEAELLTGRGGNCVISVWLLMQLVESDQAHWQAAPEATMKGKCQVVCHLPMQAMRRAQVSWLRAALRRATQNCWNGFDFLNGSHQENNCPC